MEDYITIKHIPQNPLIFPFCSLSEQRVLIGIEKQCKKKSLLLQPIFFAPSPSLSYGKKWSKKEQKTQQR